MASDIVDEDWNDDLAGEVTAKGVDSLVVYSRDWTVDTILRQVEQGNIDLNPQFQRRNAWTDAKRSKLIESLIIGVPVPEIVLAEDITRKKSFIVIDGKQRLLALAGFADNQVYKSWEKPVLRDLKTRPDLNDQSVDDLRSSVDDYRQLMNADIRCTVISNYQSSDVLYDIFYRLNTGSVPLSSQELRQVLKRGPFSDFLISATNTPLPLHEVLRLKGPDKRLRDAEIVLRYIAISICGSSYKGSLTPFLDGAAELINGSWKLMESAVLAHFDAMNVATSALIDKFGKRVGRKALATGWESRFNRALFEVQVYYFALIPSDVMAKVDADTVQQAFASFCSGSSEFRDAIETTTKNPRRYRKRYELFQEFVNALFGTSINSVPVP
ncbi:hypothetical protein A7X76_07735 [Stenotrophomonas maltophilia]|uniref:DUF262 domain-containing protein n=1 Tax=Stenotrophomonas maltophilia TaxID=40324 RepID=UPI000DA9A4AB|nr:DUF262 domain-containing protein [Stenotrophomonas maltophilia]PZS71968.1 hypothetical protein A7X76_07735 [Stenotrophomonas maltophilia]